MSDIPKLLCALAGGTQAQANKHDVIFLAAAAEIERLRADKDALWQSNQQNAASRRADEQLITDLRGHYSRQEQEIERLRLALALYAERIAPGQYQFCGHHPAHDDLLPSCDCESNTGCKRVAALMSGEA